MYLPPEHGPILSDVCLSECSLPVLLKRGFNYIQEGAYAEAAALLTLALEQLPASQTQLSSILHAFLHCYENYCSVQQTLQKACLCFAEAQGELQEQVTCFTTSLAAALMPTSNSEEPAFESTQGSVGAWACPRPPWMEGSMGLPGEDKPTPLRNPKYLPVEGPETVHDQAMPPDQLSAQMAQQALPVKNGNSLPELFVTCFGRFTVRRLNEPVVLCPSRVGQGILRYLIAQPGHDVSKDTLHVMFWPEDAAEVAQRKLHIAVSALRRSLHQGLLLESGTGYILYKNGIYSLNPLAVIHSDVYEFIQSYRLGQQKSDQRITLYQQACQLYTGPFLPEDLYADWSFLQREQLSQMYLVMCHTLASHYLASKRFQEAAQWSTTILKENHCDEAAHRLLITIYAAQGHRSEALQQFQHCESILREELGVQPLPATRQALQIALANDVETDSNIKPE